MELTIEQFMAYVPHGLEIIWNDSKDIYGVTYENETDYQKKMYPLSTLIFTMRRRGDLEWKPILLPLSDLTKEIEVNGERFVPIEELENCHDFSILHFAQIMENPLRYPYTIVQKLIEWKFDVFSLIPANLAIDKNTLNK